MALVGLFFNVIRVRVSAVKIAWRNGKRRKVHIIGTHEPEQLAEAIQTARAMAERKALERA
jgi:hypothetical protein